MRVGTIRHVILAVCLAELPADGAASAHPPAVPAISAEERIAREFNYDDPAATEQHFSKLATQAQAAHDTEAAAIYLSQVARAQGLRSDLAVASSTLSAAARLATGPSARLRVLIERGRIARRQGDTDRSRRLFARAYEEAGGTQLPSLAADAAHMLALIAPPGQVRLWVDRGLAAAESSDDPGVRRWIGVIAWNWAEQLREAADYTGAALYYARSLAERRVEGDAELIRATEHSLAAALRQAGSCLQTVAIETRLIREATRSGQYAAAYWAEIAQCQVELRNGVAARQAAAAALAAGDEAELPTQIRERLRQMLGVSQH